MIDYTHIAAALFLPLFPLSMLFIRLFAMTPHVLLRVVLLLAWPQAGVLLTGAATTAAPAWFIGLALLTSALYALRALALRDVNLWIGFLAVSSWSLLWLARAQGVMDAALHLYALGFSLPLALLALLGAVLERRFGAAYSGLNGGLAQALPRLSTLLVLVVLAVVATPVFPAFSTMLVVLQAMLPAMPLAAVAVGGIWLLWSWAGARLLQGLIVGPGAAGTAGEGRDAVDLGRVATGAYGLAVVALVLAGSYLMGGVA